MQPVESQIIPENKSQKSSCSIKTLKWKLSNTLLEVQKCPTKKSLSESKLVVTQKKRQRRNHRHSGDIKTVIKFNIMNSDNNKTPQEGYNESDLADSFSSESECSFEEFDIEEYQRITGHPLFPESEGDPSIFLRDDMNRETIQSESGSLFQEAAAERDLIPSKSIARLTLGETEIERILLRIEVNEELASLLEVPKQEITRPMSCNINQARKIGGNCFGSRKYQ